MPIYVFTCPKNHITEEYRSVKDFVAKILCRCGLKATITVTNTLYVRTFKPYVEENFDGNPRLITSSKQRDELCKQFSTTYDSNKYFRKPKYKSCIDDLNLGDVKKVIDRGRLDDGTPLDKPVRKKEKFDKNTKVINGK